MAIPEDSPPTRDELQWLESPYDRRARAWARRRTEQARDYLTSLPCYGRVSQALKRTLSQEATEPRITIVGDRALRVCITSDRRFGLLQTAKRDATGTPTRWYTVLDVDELRRQTGLPYEIIAPDFWLYEACLPPDYTRCLLRLSLAGSLDVEIREFDLEKADFVPAGFCVPRARVVLQWLNKDSVLLGETASPNAPRTVTGMPAAIKLWHRGQSLGEARTVYQAESGDSLVWLSAAGSDNQRYGLVDRSLDFSTREIRVVHQDGRSELIPLPRDCLKPWSNLQSVHAGPKAVFGQLRRDLNIFGARYSAGTLLSYQVNPALPETQRMTPVFSPEPGEFIDGPAVTTRDEFNFVIKRRLVPKVVALDAFGRGPVREVFRADPGQAVTRLSGDHVSDDVVVTVEGFVTPCRQTLYRISQPPRVLAEQPPSLDGSLYMTDIGAVTSTDGTQIDYFLLKARAPKFEGPQPLLVTGYAAFGTSFSPGYLSHNVGGPSFKLWLDRGGALVVPAARGGGEGGDAWHRAALREHRQNSYDDFISVIEELNRRGFAHPSRTGVFGLSNGGLLAAVLATQRPDLFAAVVCDVPLTDLVRMKYMGMGAAWTHEYGDPADPVMRRVLETYSPLQNVRPGMQYPPFFISVSTEDDCVGPGHGRKLAARLEAIRATVFVYEATAGGHSVSDAYKNLELMTLRAAFLIDRLMQNGGLDAGA
jgi:prolyl oligopeptidase